MTRRLNVLLIGRKTSREAGHVITWSHILPDALFRKRIVCLKNTEKGLEECFYDSTLLSRLRRHVSLIAVRTWECLRLLSPIIVNKRDYRHSFSRMLLSPISAKAILRKAGDFKPDIILLGHVSDILTPAKVRELHDLTRATILFDFVDEGHLAGGCYYHYDCTGYLHACDHCPALLLGKRYAAKVLSAKRRYWTDMPMMVCSTPYDRAKAEQTDVFRHAHFFSPIAAPVVSLTPRDEARRQFDIEEGRFVILFGASEAGLPRKGLTYALQAIHTLSSRYDDICLLLLGHISPEAKALRELPKNVEVIIPGRLSLDDLFTAFCASDCHLSTTIADSGPMMVNYSIACGTPVVAFPVGVAPDIVLHRETGYIARYKDADDVAAGLAYLHTLTPRERDAMQKRALALMDDLRRTQRPIGEDIYSYMTEKQEPAGLS